LNKLEPIILEELGEKKEGKNGFSDDESAKPL
jgi:hypothetical protein